MSCCTTSSTSSVLIVYILRSLFDCSYWDFTRARVEPLFIYSAILILGHFDTRPIEHLRHYICQKPLLMLYYSLVSSHTQYGILVWGSTNHSILHPLQVLQNQIIKIICNVSKNEHVKNNIFYHNLKLIKVNDMYHLKMAKFMHLFQHNKLPNLYKQYFTSTKTVHKYNTRCSIVTATFVYML